MADSTNDLRTRPSGSAEPLHRAYDTALLDLDGVVYAGGSAVPHAVPALAEAREAGMGLAYVTNNAARTPRTVAEHLSALGVPAAPEEVVTSAQAVARLMAEALPAGARVLCAGGEGLRTALVERGLTPVDSAEEEPAAVVQGYGGPDLPWGVLTEAALAVNRGLPWYASNTDLTIPSGRGIAPGNGAAVEVVRIANGHRRAPVVAGKPQPPMHRETIIRTGARRPLVIGDRLDTDIEGAWAGGVDSLLVLTGVADPAQLLAAGPRHRPTYVADDLRGLLAPHPEVRPVADGGFGCGRWWAGVASGRLAVRSADGAGGADRLDGLRALCAAAWSADGEPDAEGALAALGW
ncbi:Haloacid Dehalogenase Superfamily Class (subfamily) IIA [Streptomyces zhaozhouensis]|uniref:Haloacid Dehalogenase Superfamily Class (Subfamily) IIA n=1 Tax=Streptomyces zhaozhouensis TaxID=1300267 RepID=A0A286DT56_9ACTN|nr:HAD-IIA family hydrolase [Streptomyces zhaozhouensis]SOD61828.1 Haloacid Dehalogenase Superfamily Class (subfamily) IIA [Streptomyces zhaozhouensis]